jgi:hypothetical protein
MNETGEALTDYTGGVVLQGLKLALLELIRRTGSQGLYGVYVDCT